AAATAPFDKGAGRTLCAPTKYAPHGNVLFQRRIGYELPILRRDHGGGDLPRPGGQLLPPGGGDAAQAVDQRRPGEETRGHTAARVLWRALRAPARRLLVRE